MKNLSLNTFFLKAIHVFDPLFLKQGVDLNRMYTIVRTKLMMDKRRVYMNWKRRSQQNEESNQLTRVLLFYTAIGGLMSLLFFSISSLVLGLVLFNGFIIFMLSMTLITDFSSVLLDTADNQIIMSLPVNSKTVFMARLIHILIYILQFLLALSIIPVIVVFFKDGVLTGIATILTTLLTCLLSVFFTWLLYLLILRFSNEEKVKEIVTYFQIVMAVIFMGSYQILPRIADYGIFNNFHVHSYMYFIPPVWMASAVDAVNRMHFSSSDTLMAASAILIPVLLFWILIKYLAPSFSKRLSAMNIDSSAAGSKETFSVDKKDLSYRIANVCCRTTIEKSAFKMVWKISGRDKTFRLQFYPTIGYMLIFVFIIVFKKGVTFNNLIGSLRDSKKFLIFVYMPFLLSSASMMISSYYDNFQASWIYHSAPVNKPGQLLTGSIKSLFVKYSLPLFLILFILSLEIWGAKIINDFVLGAAINFLCLLIISIFSSHYLPFSQQQSTQQKSGRLLIMILQGIVVGALVGLHYVIIGNTLLIYLVTIVAVIASWLCLKKLQNLSWNKISV